MVIVALFGLGVVGRGVVDILKETRLCDHIHCYVRSHLREKPEDLGFVTYHYYLDEILTLEDVSVWVEVMGGVDAPAWTVIRFCLEQGRNVVTANKALLAHRMDEIEDLLKSNEESAIFYEAAVGGTLPVIHTIHRFHPQDPIESITAVINGTTNFVLDQMTTHKKSMRDACLDARSAGLMEADSSADLGGYDAMHKISILARISFGYRSSKTQIRVPSFNVTKADIKQGRWSDSVWFHLSLVAKVRNCVIRQVAYCDRLSGLQCVFNAFVDKNGPLSVCTPGSSNCIIIKGKYSGQTVIAGSGAGSAPTARAVVSDISEAMKNCKFYQGFSCHELAELPTETVPSFKIVLGQYEIQGNPIDHPRGFVLLD